MPPSTGESVHPSKPNTKSAQPLEKRVNAILGSYKQRQTQTPERNKSDKTAASSKCSPDVSGVRKELGNYYEITTEATR